MRYRLLASTLCVLAVLSAGLSARGEKRVNVSGTWRLSVDVGDVHGMPTVVLQQKGGVLTGTITQPRGQQMLTGTVEGANAVFMFEAVRDGRTVTGVYRGTLESKKTMSGTVDFTGASGTWVATKK